MIPKLKSRHGLDVPYKWVRTPGVVGTLLAFTGLVVVLATLGAVGILASQHLLVLLIGVGTIAVAFGALTIVASRHETRRGLRPAVAPRR